MTARDIQRALLRDRWQRSICCPNYTPPKWWECDLFELMKSGYFREYEIKLTISDFKADAKKEVRRWDGWNADISQTQWKTRHKHTELAAGDVRGPAQFWFVAPAGIILEDQVPAWAGLITAEYDQRWRRIYLVEMKRAPRLHRTKIDEAFRQDLLTTFYFRFQRLFLKRPENEHEKENQAGVLDEIEGRDKTSNHEGQAEKTVVQVMAQDSRDQ